MRSGQPDSWEPERPVGSTRTCFVKQGWCLQFVLIRQELCRLVLTFCVLPSGRKWWTCSAFRGRASCEWCVIHAFGGPHKDRLAMECTSCTFKLSNLWSDCGKVETCRRSVPPPAPMARRDEAQTPMSRGEIHLAFSLLFVWCLLFVLIRQGLRGINYRCLLFVLIRQGRGAYFLC